MLPAQIHDRRQVNNVSVHAEDGIHHDQRSASGRLLQALRQRAHVIVRKGQQVRPGNTAAIRDAGVVPLIPNDAIAPPDQGRNCRQIGDIAAAEDEGVFGLHELGQLGFQLAVDGGGPRQEPGAVVAGTELGESRHGRLLQMRMPQQPEILVRTEHQHTFPIHDDPGAVVPGNLGFKEIQPHLLHRPDPTVQAFVVLQQIRRCGDGRRSRLRRRLRRCRWRCRLGAGRGPNHTGPQAIQISGQFVDRGQFIHQLRIQRLAGFLLQFAGNRGHPQGIHAQLKQRGIVIDPVQADTGLLPEPIPDLVVNQLVGGWGGRGRRTGGGVDGLGHEMRLLGRQQSTRTPLKSGNQSAAVRVRRYPARRH